jgi:hypothetical protein
MNCSFFLSKKENVEYDSEFELIFYFFHKIILNNVHSLSYGTDDALVEACPNIYDVIFQHCLFEGLIFGDFD